MNDRRANRPLTFVTSFSQLVRVRSKDGLFRFTLEPSDDAAKLIEQVSDVGDAGVISS